ncbi:ABC-type amino acid transport substrate-binding protein [Peptoniphilus koenoeneniae]|uniref:ABC-type amino acid transport substrate-binding protein n=1 Tax=Peptoniphilus koenoeneniae TaxID=507751 RepID=A0ABU0AV12_9FIRM|nr:MULTISPECIES: transporter substrate-binding domain-containing protein [Peptoniphilus]ERT57308.1 ABC transporter, substrate-binding protein, family 3 [Peptoniphilus sp. BV3C26]MDQ0275109.1 ABC-type amino acid transport substrate-binding protein [Peptoniphilus koenoeneniae]
MKKLISILLVSIMILTSCGSKDSQQAKEKKDSETFTVGMEAMYAPYNWTQTDDKNGAVPIADTKEFANGYDVQIAKKIADSLGKKLVIQKMEWSGLIPALQAGYIDAIIGGMSPTDKRREEIDFSDLYWKSDLIVVVKKDSKYKDAKSINDFAGAKLTGQLNTFHYDVLDQMPGIDKQDPIGDFSQERVALKSGIIDGYVAELPEGLSITKAVDDFTYVSFEEGKGFDVSDSDIGIAVGLKKDNTELKDKINEFLKTLTQEDRQKLMEEALSVQPISEAN